jgi:superfamily II DNA or RNA helicase/HKD family nuclease
MTLPEGIYDLLVTDALLGRLPDRGAVLHDLHPDAAIPYLVDALSQQLRRVLEDLPEDANPLPQLELVNALIAELRRRVAPAAGDPVALPPRVLKAVGRAELNLAHPEIGLAQPWLFTAGKGAPSLLQEIRREISTADDVSILVSFIQVSGVRKLRDVLQQLTVLDGEGRPRTRIRIITTTYTGATEQRALNELASLPGCTVRVSLDGRRTRLHAKAWIFHRNTGFGSAYVGSANLSHSALTGGVEWTVKMTQRGQPALFERAVAHFESLWDDDEFQPYDPRNEAHQRALAAALHREGGVATDDVVVRGFFDLSPKTYQQEMLEALALERHHGRYRNLLVAATGTGKTVVAAFDYRRTVQEKGGRPRLLFVAHREEILRQALRVFREVLRDPDFGELLAGGSRTERFDHLFATIDSLTSRELVAQLGANYWHTVVIDECHRVAADRFDAFARAIEPHVLLGLTATPERSDGQPILGYFDCRPDGSPAVELRLWHALDMQLLAPFEYYACDEPTDFSAVPWDRPGERDAMLDQLLSANDARAHLVMREWQRLASDPRRGKALVFCVSVAHAQFMTDKLNRAGLPAICVVGTTDHELRRKAPQLLASNEVCALVTVDLYNEGVDLPDVDTLLLLRPTQSPVLFQQQIGRGLRLAPNKDACLVLDFVGQHRADFRFDRLLGTLTGLSRLELRESVEEGFGSLPPGCHIHLQPQVRDQVLRGLRALTQQNWRRLRTELNAYVALRGRSAVNLTNFVREQGIDLADVYRGGEPSGWSRLQRDAGLVAAEPGPEELYFSRRFSALLHTDDPLRLDTLQRVAEGKTDLNCSDPLDRATVQMLAYQVDALHDQQGTGEAFLDRLYANPAACTELAALTGLLQARSTLPMQAVPGLEDTPLCMYASYSAREILTAVGWLTAERKVPFVGGVLPLANRKVELLFVTLDKAEGYHHGIAYRDYAISAERFHWQTQNAAGPDTPAGRRYIESAANGWRYQLFVRTRRSDPYRPCGPVRLESWEGERPMSIVWRLERPLPAKLFREFSVLRS